MTVEELVNPQSSALLVVDMQNDYCHPEGAQAALGADVMEVRAMAPRLAALLSGARSAGVRTIFIRTLHSPWTNSAAWLKRGSGRHAQSAVRLCLPGTWGAEFYDVLQPREHPDCDPEHHDFVVTKHRYSGFVGTDLELVLRAQNVQNLIMTGTATDGCVEATARDGFMKDFSILFVSDCTAAATAARHSDCLSRARSFASVAPSDAVIAAWQRAAITAPSPA